MKYIPIVSTVVFVLILIGGVFVFSRKNPEASPQPAVLSTADLPVAPFEANEYFWGEGCSHCANVEEFLANWDKKDEVEVEKFEVYKNRENQALMAARVQSCEPPLKQIAVPFLYTIDGQCLIGDERIIEYFKNYSAK